MLAALIHRLRRNHALEHATIHILSRLSRDVRVMGHSTPLGFVLYGDLPTEIVLQAVQEALARLKAGQRELAVHPTCGTNYVTSGVLAGLGAFVVLTPRRRSLSEWLSRLPLVLLVSTFGFMIGQRLGMSLQAAVTTEARVGELRVASVVREERGPLVRHRVYTEG